MTSSNLILNRVFSKNTLRALLDDDKKASNVYYATIKRYITTYKNKIERIISHHILMKNSDELKL